VDLRFFAVLGSDTRLIGNAVPAGDVRDFKVEMRGREYLSRQYRDGTTLMYRRGGLVAEIKTDADGVTGVNQGDVVEYYDRDGTLLKRTYPDGVIEYYDAQGNLIGREDPHAGMSFVEKPVQRKRRKAWNKKLTVRTPRNVVPKGLGKIKDILGIKSEKKLIILDDVDGENKIAKAISMTDVNQAGAEAKIATTAVDMPNVLTEGTSGFIPGVLMFMHAADQIHDGSSEDTSHVEKTNAVTQEYSGDRGIASHSASTDVMIRSFVASTPNEADDRFNEAHGRNEATSSHRLSYAGESESKTLAACSDKNDVDASRSPRERADVPAPHLSTQSALFAFSIRERGKDNDDERHDTAKLSLYGRMTFGDSKQQVDGSEHLAEAPRYPSIPISGPVAPWYKMEIKSSRIIMDPSDPEQADYDQPEDDRQQHKHQDEDHQEEQHA
jgi:YD repeat-containing protein